MLLMLDDAKDARPSIHGGETKGEIQGDKQTFIIDSPLGTQRTLSLIRLSKFIHHILGLFIIEVMVLSIRSKTKNILNWLSCFF